MPLASILRLPMDCEQFLHLNPLLAPLASGNDHDTQFTGLPNGKPYFAT